MQRFSYVRARDVPQAVELLNEPGQRSRVLAGGTDLVLLAREERDLCDRVVDITCVPELHAIRQAAGTVTIGACATFSEVIASPVVNASAPLLVEACRQIGALQIRNMGTLGGNVANAAACADSLPALVCLDAVARVLAPGGEFTRSVAEIVVRPNRTLIPAGGLLVSLAYQAPPPGSRGVFLKLGRRSALAISRLTVAALGRLDADGRIAEARLVPGSATPQIRHFTGVERSLLGCLPEPGLLAEAGRLAVEEMALLSGRRWSSEYKEPALSAMVSEALGRVFLPTGGGNA